MKRGLIIIGVVLVLAGCGDSPRDRRYESCIKAGGSYSTGAWGDFRCTLPDGPR